ncbi:MAG: hypothetical protein AAF726_19670 [Planctomycetota bacterium]
MQQTASDSVTHSDDWEYVASAYAWFAQKNGSVETDNVVLTLDDPDESTGAFLYFSGRKGNWGFLADFDYISTEDGASAPGGTAVVEEESIIAELDATWSPTQAPTLRILAGIRVLDSEQDIRFPLLPPQTIDTTLIDPVIGAQGTWQLSDTIVFRIRGDIGGFGLDSDFTYQGFGVFAWEFVPHWYATLGYRVLGWEFEDDGVRNDLRLSGGLLGVAAKF